MNMFNRLLEPVNCIRFAAWKLRIDSVEMQRRARAHTLANLSLNLFEMLHHFCLHLKFILYTILLNAAICTLYSYLCET